MDYRSALNHLLELNDLERMISPTRKRVRYDLSRMEVLLLRLGNPQVGIPTVHIAGTKGKGSTAAMCASVIAQQGYHTGLYTSPHLHSFRERIRLDGKPVTEEEFASLVEQVWPELEWVSNHGGHGEATMFEALTAMAFSHFRKRAGFQVLEVGLGGRLDTTNVVSPQVCAITSLSLDHTSILGNTLESIATEKAGIIKLGIPVVSSPQKPEAMAVIEAACRENEAKLIKVGEDLTWSRGPIGLDGQGLEVQGRLGKYMVWTPLLGDYQLENVTTAVGTLEALQEQGFPISERALHQGLREVCWPCRMEVLSREPLVVCDGAHNPYSVAKLRDSLPGYFNYGSLVLIVGVSADKNLEGIVEELAGFSQFEQEGSPAKGRGCDRAISDIQGRRGRKIRVIVTRSRHPRAAPTGPLAEAFLHHGIEAVEVEAVDQAVDRALDEVGEDDPRKSKTLVLATGSLFVAAEVREAIKGIEPELYPELQRNL